MNRVFLTGAVLVVVIGAIAGGLLGRLPDRTSADTGITSERLVADYREALGVIDASYVTPVDYEKITDTSMQSMLWTLDPHSAFFTRDEFRKLDEEQSSQYYGIGVSILQHRDGVYVKSVMPETPADKAGLRYGDRFLTVDGKDATEWTSPEVSKNVRGERDTTVKLKVERASSPAPLEIDIVRGGVPLPSVRNYFMLSNDVGYIGMTGGFQQTTSEELSLAMGDLKKRGMKSLVLDLRGNPGGILEQAVGVVSKFIPGGQTVVSVKGAQSTTMRELKAFSGQNEDIPLVVMINGGSASASEIVAGAIQDHNRGVVVGTESFGKGLVQRVFRLPFGTGMTLTTARYYTPFGRSLQREYSLGSIYEYYTNGDQEDEDAAEKPLGDPVTTANGRILYGGRGIVPDIKILPERPNAARARVNEAAFFFVRELVAGKIAGFEDFRVEKQNFRMVLQRDEFVISDRLFDAFRSYAVSDPDNGLAVAAIDSQAVHARKRLREEIATANFSNEAGVQVLLESDVQVLKALESVPQAQKLVAAARPVAIM